MVDLSIIVPCYNEEDNLEAILKGFDAVVKEEGIEVILVNNGSTDNTKDRLKSLLLEYPFAWSHTVTHNQGYGFGILSGLEVAKGKVLAWTHADMQTDPEDVLKAYILYQAENNEDIFIKGKRIKRKLGEYILTLGMQIIASVLLRVRLDDINAQPKLFSRKFYEEHIKHQAPYDFSLDLFALYKANKYVNIKTLPVFFKNRLHGEAKGGGANLKTRLRIITRTLKFIVRLSRTIHSA